MVASDSDSAGETPFTDAASETDGGRSKRRKKQVSVPEMVRRAASRNPKRPAPSLNSPSPGRAGSAAAVPEAVQQAGQDRGVELNAASLSAIQQLIDSGIARAVAAFEAKFEHLEKRISVLECEGMSRENELQRVKDELEKQIAVNRELQQEVENIDMNGRLSSLILTCSEFEVRHQEEDIEERVVDLLNRRFTDLKLTAADLHVALS